MKNDALTLRGGGTATVVADRSRPATWQTEGRTLKLAYNTPFTIKSVSSNIPQWEIHTVHTGVAFTDVAASNGSHSTAAVLTLGYTTEAARPAVGARQELTPRFSTRRYEKLGEIMAVRASTVTFDSAAWCKR